VSCPEPNEAETLHADYPQSYFAQVDVPGVDANLCTCECSDPDGKAFTLTIPECVNYVAFSPRDAERLLKYCKNKKR
jgi:hypothetical protein